MGFNRFIDFLHDAKHLSAVDKSAFADILGESAWSLTLYIQNDSARDLVLPPLVCNTNDSDG